MEPIYHKLGIDDISLERILNFLPYPFLLSDSTTENRYNIFVNKKFQDEIGYSCDDIPTIGDWFVKAYPERSYRKEVEAQWSALEQQALAMGKDSLVMKALIQTRSFGKKWYEVKASISGNVRLVAFINVHDDMILREELHSLNENKDRTLSILSHDLRVPFGNLLSVLHLAEAGHLSTAETEGSIKDLSLKVFQVMEFLDTTLHWTRINFEKIHLTEEVIDLQAIINLIFLLYKKSLADKDISFSIDFVQHQQIKSDPEVINIILRNIISNAIKFTLPHGNIAIWNTIDHDKFVLKVRNSGKGMSPERIAQVMADHYKPQAGTSGEKGLGLGLQLCRQLLGKIGGRLNIESVQGENTTVEIYL